MIKSKFKVISIIIYIIAIIMLAVIVFPMISMYREPNQFKQYIDGFGAWGMAMMFFIQISQIIVALIPGELVEFVAGTLYGCIGGLIFCLVGIAIGQIIIFQSVKFLGKDFVEKAAGSNAMQKLKFLQNEKKLKLIIFILFFIPGTPKDLLTYVVPFTKIKIRDFIILTTAARIPSVISSTFAGSAYASQNYSITIIVYAVIGVISLLCLLIYRIWEKRKVSDKPASPKKITEYQSKTKNKSFSGTRSG